MTVKQKQCLLAYLGYYTGVIDGIWGPQSQQATESFQRDYQLTVDGVFGDGTLQRIKEVIYNGEAPQQSPAGATEDSPATGTFWDEIKYFTREEFKCPCPRCGGFPVEPDQTLVELADDVREHFGLPMIPSSGVRCQAHNDELPNSVPNSRHVRGKALDFCIPGKTSAQILGYVNGHVSVNYAYAIDSSYVHMDVE